MKPTFISVKELCECLSIGRTKAYELIQEGKLDTARIGRRRLITWKSVKAYASAILEIEGQ